VWVPAAWDGRPGSRDTSHTSVAGSAVRVAATAVSLGVERGGLLLLIADDGKGLPTPVVRGVGLRSMAHRAVAASDTFDVASTESGTVVRAWFPVLHVDEIRVAPASVTVTS
jgi:signal transduction histidine kinase